MESPGDVETCYIKINGYISGLYIVTDFKDELLSSQFKFYFDSLQIHNNSLSIKL